VTPPDAALLEAVRRGDAKALETLLERHAPAVHRFARTLCRHPEDAEEVLQETLLAAARNLDRFREEASVSTWLFTIARRACMRLARRRAGEPEHFAPLDDAPLAAASDDPQAHAERDEARRRLYAALHALSPSHREVILLRDIEERPAAEVAAILGIEVGAVKSRLHRARARLRAILRADASLPPPSPDGGCFEVEEALSRMVEGDLPKPACDRLSAHVDACPRCKARCDTLGAILSACHDLAAEPTPPSVRRVVTDTARRALVELAAPSAPNPRGDE